MERGAKLILFLVYLVFGLYFINQSIKYIEIPAFFNEINSWIFLIGGALIILGGINYLRASNSRYRRRHS